MADDVPAALRALAAVAASHGDQPWTVSWLVDHADRAEAGDEAAVVEVRDRLVDLERNLVIDHEDLRARRIIAVIREQVADVPGPNMDPLFRAMEALTYTDQPPPSVALVLAITGAVAFALSVAAILTPGSCGDLRRGVGLVAGVVAGVLGIVVIPLRSGELRRQSRPEEASSDPTMLTGVGLILAMALAWLFLHFVGCDVLGY
jgi:hypothetical protein